MCYNILPDRGLTEIARKTRICIKKESIMVSLCRILVFLYIHLCVTSITYIYRRLYIESNTNKETKLCYNIILTGILAITEFIYIKPPNTASGMWHFLLVSHQWQLCAHCTPWVLAHYVCIYMYVYIYKYQGNKHHKHHSTSH